MRRGREEKRGREGKGDEGGREGGRRERRTTSTNFGYFFSPSSFASSFSSLFVPICPSLSFSQSQRRPRSPTTLPRLSRMAERSLSSMFTFHFFLPPFSPSPSLSPPLFPLSFPSLSPLSPLRLFLLLNRFLEDLKSTNGVNLTAAAVLANKVTPPDVRFEDIKERLPPWVLGK